MGTSNPTPPITIFTPSFADECNTNAQNLTVKEIVVRLPSGLFRVIMLCSGCPDPRIAARKNTTLLPYYRHGNVAQLLARLAAFIPDIYFFPREGPLDSAFLFLRKHVGLKTALGTYIVSGGLDQGDLPPERARNVREADVVLGNNTYLTNLLRQRLGVDAGTIYDGIDRRFYFPRRKSEAPTHLTVLYAGSFRPYKRVELVVREAARLPKIMFRLAGTGEEEQYCRQLALHLGCRNVTFLGHLASAELGEEMRRADVFFFPSILEGHPQVLGQAAACGLPAIAMKHYRPDYVVNGKTGFLAESDRDLTESLDQVLQNADLRQSIAQAAIRHSLKFDWDEIALQWASIFQQAVAARAKLRGGGRARSIEAANSSATVDQPAKAST